MSADLDLVRERAGIREEDVYDFDMYRDPELVADPYARIERLLKEAPRVFWTPRNAGHWMVIGYPAIFEASRDPDRFSNNSPQMLASGDQTGGGYLNGRRIPAPYPSCLDKPLHDKFRGPLQKVFSPSAVIALKNNVVRLAEQIIADLVPQGHCDGVSEIAEQLPIIFFLQMLGLPIERRAEFREVMNKFLSPPDAKTPQERDVEMAHRVWMVLDVMKESVLACRDHPSDNIISMLWQLEIDGEKLTYEHMENYGIILFTAGLDTVTNGMAHGMRHLAMDQALQHKLRQDPALIPAATEELLRRYTFATPWRIVARDTEFYGRTMKRGDKIVLYLPTANIDEAVFEKPFEFNLERENKTHIAFGAGPHRCLASHLARVELQVLYETLLKLMPQFEIDPARRVSFSPGHVIGVSSLPLRWQLA